MNKTNSLDIIIAVIKLETEFKEATGNINAKLLLYLKSIYDTFAAITAYLTPLGTVIDFVPVPVILEVTPILYYPPIS